MAEKVQAWLDARKLNWGLLIKTVKGPEPKTHSYGSDWMVTSPTTILVITLDYHENPFWLNSPAETHLKRFLRKDNCDLIKRDVTRWYVIEKSPHLKEAMTPGELVNASKKPKFVPYKSQVTGKEGMALYIGWPEAITQSQWSQISRIMNQKGYYIHGAADAQHFVYGYMHKFQNRVPPVLQDWINTIALVLDVKAPSQSPDVKTTGATPANKVFHRAVKEWGTTHDPALAGYILPSGAMLDLSGRRQGGGSVRAFDHRQVEQFFDEHFPERGDAMHAFMDMGAIRWVPEANGIDIRTPPTPRQLTALRNLLNHVQGENIYVDVYWPNYGKAAAEYPGRTSPERIVRDIQHFYKTGEMRQLSPLERIHLTAESAVDTLLQKSSDTLLFVYGTLRSGEEAHDKLKTAESLGKVRTKPEYAIEAKKDDCKTLVPGNEAVEGELYRVDDATLCSADEWESSDYDRKPVRLEDGRSAQAYFMKTKESLYAEAIVSKLLETEQMELPLDHDEDEGEPTGEVLSPEEISQWLNRIGITKGYEQIDGDYSDPWVFGGTWFSQGVENDPEVFDSIVHIDGLEGEGLHDYDSRSKKVLRMMVEEPAWRDKVAARVAEIMPKKLREQGIGGEPASDHETIEWCRKEATDEAQDEIGEQIASKLNANREMTVYRTNADDPNSESWVTNHLTEILSNNGLTHEQWMEMGPARRVCAVASYHGWYELDQYQIKMSKQELMAKLGIEL